MYNFVFGVGFFANQVVDKLMKFGVRVDGMLKLKEFYMPIFIEPNQCVNTYCVEDLKKLDPNLTNVIIAQKPIIMGDTISYLKNMGFKNVFIVDEEMQRVNIHTLKEFNCYLYPVNMEKPFLNYLEMNIVDNCNLNCKGCAHFSNIFDNGYVSLDSFTRDLIMLSNKFELYYFRLLGGEPLLHPNIIELVKIARKILKNTKIIIVTNGLLINKLNNDVLKAFAENNITICISVYKPTLNILNNIISKLEYFGINYILNDDYMASKKSIESFSTRLTASQNNNAFESSRKCLGRFCRFLRDGKISKCYYPLLIDVLNRKMGTNFVLSAEDYVEIKNITDGWLAIEQLNKPIPFCNYCSENEFEFNWEGYHKNDLDVYQYILKK